MRRPAGCQPSRLVRYNGGVACSRDVPTRFERYATPPRAAGACGLAALEVPHDGPRLVPWQTLLAHPGPDGYLVQLYQDEGFFGEAVSHFVAHGVAQGDAVILVATGPHWDLLADCLAGKGLDVVALRRHGQLPLLDADATLPTFLVRTLPDAPTFKALARATIAQARAGSRSGRVRWWGEMVNVLFVNGNGRGSTRLEELFDEVAHEESIAIFCSFLMDPFDATMYAGPLQAVCGTHAHLIPVANEAHQPPACTGRASTSSGRWMDSSWTPSGLPRRGKGRGCRQRKRFSCGSTARCLAWPRSCSPGHVTTPRPPRGAASREQDKTAARGTDGGWTAHAPPWFVAGCTISTHNEQEPLRTSSRESLWVSHSESRAPHRAAQRVKAHTGMACPSRMETPCAVCCSSGRTVASFLPLREYKRRTRRHRRLFPCGHLPARADWCGTAHSLAQGRGLHGWHQHGKEHNHGEHHRQDQRGHQRHRKGGEAGRREGQGRRRAGLDKSKDAAARGAEKVKDTTDRAAEKVKEA